jgi:hypothetical protein
MGQIIVRQKKCAFFFWQKGIAKNVQERAMSERKAEKG